MELIIYSSYDGADGYTGPCKIYDSTVDIYRDVIIKVLRRATRKEYLEFVREVEQEQYINSEPRDTDFYYKVQVLD